jgi:hypothetical protein
MDGGLFAVGSLMALGIALFWHGVATGPRWRIVGTGAIMALFASNVLPLLLWIEPTLD